MTLSHPVRLAFLSVALLCASATSVQAQSFGASAGLAAPLGPLAEQHDIGWRVQGSAHLAGGQWRLDAAAVTFPGNTADSSYTAGRDYRSFSLAGNLLPTVIRSESTRLRALVGLSVHRVDVERLNNPYGMVAGGQLGGVLERAWNGHALTAEAGVHLIATDHGLGELDAAYFIPMGIGIRW
jgi:hypothetical protein